MRINKSIEASVIEAVNTLLKHSVPDLTSQTLLAALQNYNPNPDAGKQTMQPPPLTRREAASLLKVSVPTINRFLRDGVLQRVKVGARLVRIPWSSIDTLLKASNGD